MITQLKSTQILNDCQRSLDLLEKVPDGDKQLFRIYWTFCLVALRRVRDALEKYDIVAFPEMRESYERRNAELLALKANFNKDTPFTELFNEYGVKRVMYGHIHGKAFKTFNYNDFKLGDTIYNTGKKIASAAKSVAKSAVNGIKKVGRAVGSAVKKVGNAIASLLGF